MHTHLNIMQIRNETDLRKRDTLEKAVRDREKQAVKEGKAPFYLKKSDKKQLLLVGASSPPYNFLPFPPIVSLLLCVDSSASILTYMYTFHILFPLIKRSHAISSQIEKFKELKKAGKLDKFLEKKRKKNANKDHRFLPSQRRGFGDDSE